MRRPCLSTPVEGTVDESSKYKNSGEGAGTRNSDSLWKDVWNIR